MFLLLEKFLQENEPQNLQPVMPELRFLNTLESYKIE